MNIKGRLDRLETVNRRKNTHMQGFKIDAPPTPINNSRRRYYQEVLGSTYKK